MNLKYLIGSILSIPLLPIMYFQGRKIKRRIPNLPEASGDKGECLHNDLKNEFVKLLAIGESTIAGVGVETHEEGFTGTLAKELTLLMGVNTQWKVYARSGYTTKMVYNKIIPNIEETDANIIVIGLGGNDAFTLSTPKRWRREIVKLIQTLQAKFPKALIVFCNMPPIKEFPAFTPLIRFTIGNLVEILGEELDHITRDHRQVFYSRNILKIDHWINKFGHRVTKEDFFSDGVHPSELTYQTWAKELAREIKDYIDAMDILMDY